MQQSESSSNTSINHPNLIGRVPENICHILLVSTLVAQSQWVRGNYCLFVYLHTCFEGICMLPPFFHDKPVNKVLVQQQMQALVPCLQKYTWSNTLKRLLFTQESQYNSFEEQVAAKHCENKAEIFLKKVEHGIFAYLYVEGFDVVGIALDSYGLTRENVWFNRFMTFMMKESMFDIDLKWTSLDRVDIQIKEDEGIMKFEMDQSWRNGILQKHSYKVTTPRWGGGLNVKYVRNSEEFPLSEILHYPRTIELLPDPDFEHYEEKSVSIPDDNQPGSEEEEEEQKESQ